MSRIRNIKPEFFDDEGLCALSPLARLCFIGLWTQADREGRLEDRPERLKVRLFPYEKKVDMAGLISELCQEGCVVRYAVQGKAYLFIPKFSEHQYLSKREPASTLPSIDEAETGVVPVLDRSNPGLSDNGQGTMDNGQGTGDKGHTAGAVVLAVTTKPEALLDLWNTTVRRLPKAQKLTEPRRRQAQARLHEEPDLEVWRVSFVRLDASDFASGQAGGWRADFDFVLRPGTLTKIQEGKYDNRTAQTALWGAGRTAGNRSALEQAIELSRQKGDLLALDE